MLLNDVNDIFVNCHMFYNSHCWGTISYGASDRLASLVTRGYIRKIRSIHGGILTRKFAASSSSSHWQSISPATQLKLSPAQLKFESVNLKSLRFPQKVLLLDSWSADYSANQLIAWALSADCPSSLSWFSTILNWSQQSSNLILYWISSLLVNIFPYKDHL